MLGKQLEEKFAKFENDVVFHVLQQIPDELHQKVGAEIQSILLGARTTIEDVVSVELERPRTD